MEQRAVAQDSAKEVPLITSQEFSSWLRGTRNNHTPRKLQKSNCPRFPQQWKFWVSQKTIFQFVHPRGTRWHNCPVHQSTKTLRGVTVGERICFPSISHSGVTEPWNMDWTTLYCNRICDLRLHATRPSFSQQGSQTLQVLRNKFVILKVYKYQYEPSNDH